MADKVNIIVTGDRKLDKALRHLEKNVQRKFARKAMRKAAKDVILPDARRMAPVETGALESSIKVRAAKRSRRGMGVIVSTTVHKSGKKDVWYANVLEFGSSKRNITADPFMRPALYGNESKIRGLFIDDLNELIREARRVGT